ncbi:MAG: serine/threonine-protein kinase [bacterium]|nr:serine/threonine-protein kinase [bacterium]
MVPEWFPIQEISELASFQEFHKFTEGGFAEIYRAIQVKDGEREEVIVKRLRPLNVQQQDHRELFANEARFLKKIHHPQIPRFIDGFLSERECFYIMEWVDGKDPLQLLNNAKSSGKEFPLELVFFVGLEIVKVLHYLHHFKPPILHSDIKPHNFLLTAEPKVYLIDFSVALELRDEEPKLQGTINFMPPERLGGKKLTVQADLFALTLSLYCLAAQEALMKPAKMAELFGEWLSEKYYEKIREQKFSKPLEEFFLKNLQFKPEKRAASAQELVKDLQYCIQALELELHPNELSKQVQDLERIST